MHCQIIVTFMIAAATAFGALGITLLAFRVVFGRKRQLRVDRLHKAVGGRGWRLRMRPPLALAMVAGLLATSLCPATEATLRTSVAASGADAGEPGSFRWLAGTAEDLQKRGVTLGGFLQLDGSHVFAGGMPDARWFDAQYLLDLGATVDTDALFGWSGGTLFVDFQSHAGPNVITTQVPALADADNMDALTTNSIDRAWYQQAWFGKKFELRVGLMYVDDQFLTVPFGQNFVSLDFSSDSSISTFVLPTYPKGAWGADVWVYPDPHLIFSLGVFRDNATELSYNPGGNLLITEEGWQGAWRTLPYKIQLGAWVDDGTFRRFRGGMKHRASGVYVVASARLWQPTGSGARGIGMFLQLGSGPPSVAAVRRHFGLGFVWTGLRAARPYDEFGIALSDSFLSSQAGFRHDFEKEIETYYQFDVSHGWTIQPDLEFWQHPSGGDTPDTWLGLVRAVFTF